WGVDPVTGYRTDGPRLPGAKYWIPTADEWLKAAHYDPDKFGPGLGGYWLFPNSSDALIQPGPPGVGETTAGWEVLRSVEWDIPLGAYPNEKSPGGLLDASGAAGEWLGDLAHPVTPNDRRLDGAPAGLLGWKYTDRADVFFGGSNPGSDGPDLGLRIASLVPSPGAGVLLVPALYLLVTRRRRF
ncbi:MAG: hypothetical protein IIB55_01105, partial [Planctomycetes bacterium]|nr:hypothetical protein [Planctomycetota bacterium]